MRIFCNNVGHLRHDSFFQNIHRIRSHLASRALWGQREEAPKMAGGGVSRPGTMISTEDLNDEYHMSSITNCFLSAGVEKQYHEGRSRAMRAVIVKSILIAYPVATIYQIPFLLAAAADNHLTVELRYVLAQEIVWLGLVFAGVVVFRNLPLKWIEIVLLCFIYLIIPNRFFPGVRAVDEENIFNF